MKNTKALLGILSLLALCLTLAVAFPNPLKNERGDGTNNQEVTTRPAAGQDLVSKSGKKILEVVEASYRTTETGLDSSSVLVRNLSGRTITAVGLLWTITFTDDRRDEIEHLVDYRIHQDIVKAKLIRPFAPFEEKFIPRLTKESFEEGQGIKSIKVEFPFVEFEGAGGIGIEKSDMYRQLLAQRRGAEIYKRWVEDGYEDSPLGVDRLAATLSGDGLPGNPEMKDDMVQRGALIYRQWMRDIIKGRGKDALREQMRVQLLQR